MSLFQWFILAVLIVMTAINMASVLWECKQEDAKQKSNVSPEKDIKPVKEKSEQLQNAIVLKFKVGQTVWCAGHDAVYYLMIDEIFVSVNNQGYSITYKEYGYEAIPEEFIFATREDAEKALAERGVQ